MSWLDTLEEIRKTDWSDKTPKERHEKAREVTNICAYASSMVAAVPIPIADLALIIPVHSLMVVTIGRIYGRPITRAEAKRVLAELGAVAGVSFAGRAAIGVVKKLLLPGIGGLLAIPATFALTWGLGRAAIAYFEHPEFSQEDLKRVFDDAVKEGKSTFSKEAFDRFRAKNQDVKPPPEDAESVRPSPEPPRAAPEPPPAPGPASPPKAPNAGPGKKRSL